MTSPRAADRATLSSADAGPAPAPEHAVRRILVVDDEPSLRRVACRVFEMAGYQVVQAGDGDEALRVLQAGDPPIHLVVADLLMPGIDGVELRRLATAAGATPPFLLTSGCAEAEVRARLGDDDTVSFIPKPWTPVELVARVRALLAAQAASP